MRYLKTYENLFPSIEMPPDFELRSYLEEKGVLDFYRKKLTDKFDFISFALVGYDNIYYQYAYSLHNNSQYLRIKNEIEWKDYYPEEEFFVINRGILYRVLEESGLEFQEVLFYKRSFPNEPEDYLE